MNRHTHMHMNGILHITWTFCQFKSGHLPISGGHQPGLVFRTTRPECRENAAPKCGDPLGSVWCFILQKCFSSLGFSKCLDLHRFSSSSGFQHHNIRIHNKSHQHIYIYISKIIKIRSINCWMILDPTTHSVRQRCPGFRIHCFINNPGYIAPQRNFGQSGGKDENMAG